MLAEKNEYLKETAQTVFRMSAQEEVIKRCRDREDYYADLRSYQKAIAKMETVIEEKDAIIASMEKQIKEMQTKMSVLPIVKEEQISTNVKTHRKEQKI